MYQAANLALPGTGTAGRRARGAGAGAYSRVVGVAGQTAPTRVAAAGGLPLHLPGGAHLQVQDRIRGLVEQLHVWAAVWRCSSAFWNEAAGTAQPLRPAAGWAGGAPTGGHAAILADRWWAAAQLQHISSRLHHGNPPCQHQQLGGQVLDQMASNRHGRQPHHHCCATHLPERIKRGAALLPVQRLQIHPRHRLAAACRADAAAKEAQQCGVVGHTPAPNDTA